MDKLLVLGSVSLSGTLLAGVTALICRGLKGKISARAVYVLWILVLLRFLCPWTTSHSLLNQAVEAPQESWTLTVPEQTGSPAAEPVSPRTSPVTTEALLWAVWLTGAGVILAVRGVSYARFSQSVLRRARPAPKETQAVYAALTGSFRRPPRMVCSPDAVTPMLMGLVRPVVVLPCLSLEGEALEALLSHELTHWRRRDLWVKRIAVAVSVLHWFNPAAWWLLGQLDRFCELACDETVCRGWDQARRARYGQLLLELCAVPAPHFAACLSKKQCLKERLIHIMVISANPLPGCWRLGPVWLCCSPRWPWEPMPHPRKRNQQAAPYSWSSRRSLSSGPWKLRAASPCPCPSAAGSILSPDRPQATTELTSCWMQARRYWPQRPEPWPRPIIMPTTAGTLYWTTAD